jgi:serine/threonine protein kinase
MADPVRPDGAGSAQGSDTTDPHARVPAVTQAGRRRSRENLGAVVDLPPPMRAAVDGVRNKRVGSMLNGRYRIVRFIASGGMGDVYEAEDRFMNEAIALKVLKPEVAGDQAALTRFRQEAQLARRITHASVCRIFDVSLGHDDDGQELAFLTMELLHGDTLSARIRKLGKLPAHMALSIAEQLASALDAAHALGIIHRDLKSANVLVIDQPNGSRRAVVMDFGIATLVDDPTRLDPTGAVLGTVGYMAPEQARGEAPTAASDIYAFGVVLHEMRTGRLPGQPHQAGTVAGRRSTFDRVTDRPLTSLEPNWDLAIRRCLEEDAEARWPSGAAVISCLRSEARSPYRGLVPFQADDRPLFFGRDRDADAILERLRASGFVLVAGSPGSGKSSICRAGVIPAVMAGALGGPTSWRVAEVVPGRSPLTAVRDVITTIRRYQTAALGRSITSDLRSVPTPESGLILFLDQLEELVTMSQPAEATELARTIGRVAAAPEPGLRILATVRTDLLGDLATFEGLREAIPRALYFLPALDHAGLRDAIVEPANHHGVRFDPPGVVEALIDAAGSPPNLPLLQFTLTELWKSRDVTTGTITSTTLEAIGGMDGALARHADRVMAELMPAQRPIAREMLALLITKSGRLQRRTAAELGAASPECRAVLDQLLSNNIIIVEEIDGELIHQLAHETLARQWATLRQLVESGAGMATIDPDAPRRTTSQKIRAIAAAAPAPAPASAATPRSDRRRWPMLALAMVAAAILAFLLGRAGFLF